MCATNPFRRRSIGRAEDRRATLRGDEPARYGVSWSRPLLTALSLVVGLTTPGWAVFTCDLDDGATCTVSTIQNVAGEHLALPGASTTGTAASLHLTGQGALDFGATGGSITVPDNLTVDLGAQITATGGGAQAGGPLTVTVGGSATVHGIISASGGAATGPSPAGKAAGTVTMNVYGDLSMTGAVSADGSPAQNNSGQPGGRGGIVSLAVDGDVSTSAASIRANGGAGGAGAGNAGAGGDGGVAGTVTLRVGGDFVHAGVVAASGGLAGNGSNGANAVNSGHGGPGGNGGSGGGGGAVSIVAGRNITQQEGTISVVGGPGGSGGHGGNRIGSGNGNGGAGGSGGSGGPAGTVTAQGCGTLKVMADGSITARGGAGGNGGAGGSGRGTGNGGSGGASASGGDGNAISLRTDGPLAIDGLLDASGGATGTPGPGGAGGVSGSNGSGGPGAPGNGGDGSIALSSATEVTVAPGAAQPPPAVDDTAQAQCTIAVNADFKPGGGDPSPFSCRSRGNVPVALLGSASFDATAVNPSTVILAGTVAALPKTALEDVNGDTYGDIVFFFPAADLASAISCPHAHGTLVDLSLGGETSNGRPFSSAVTIRIVGGGKH